MISETMISETMISRTRRTTAFGILVVAFAVNIATSGLTVAEDFVRGDVNGDGIASYADVVYNCQWQFLGLQVVTCLDAAVSTTTARLTFSTESRSQTSSSWETVRSPRPFQLREQTPPKTTSTVTRSRTDNS